MMLPTWLEKIYKWEFWSFGAVYWPIFIYFILISIRFKTLAWLSYVNPGMEYGGFVDTAKDKVMIQFDRNLVPKECLILDNTSFEECNNLMKKNKLFFPIIAKPNKGQRGTAVEKINSADELFEYLTLYSDEIVLQEFIDLDLEYGVFYHRIPNKKNGTIMSLMERKFFTVTGDGKQTLQMLIKNNKRGRLYTKLFFSQYQSELEDIIKKGHIKKLGVIGNHCKGTTFLDSRNKITQKLISTFDNISKQVDGFYYGRYDIKAQTFEDLESGNIKIIELNGANSEPAHIYQPGYKYWNAMKDLFFYWNILYNIARINKKSIKSIPSSSEFWHVVQKNI